MSLFLDKMLMYWLSCRIRQQGTTVPLSTCASQVKILYSPTHTSPGTIWWSLFPTLCGISYSKSHRVFFSLCFIWACSNLKAVCWPCPVALAVDKNEKR